MVEDIAGTYSGDYKLFILIYFLHFNFSIIYYFLYYIVFIQH
jgi:hypothetical protein